MEDLKMLAAQTDDNPFKKLPNELIISHIFDKVSEAKSLCRCSLVSKKFSSLVFQTKTVSFKIPLSIPTHYHHRSPRLAVFPGKLVHAVTYPQAFIDESAYQFIKKRSSPPHCSFDFDFVMESLPNFLGKFTQLRSLLVEFDYSASQDNNLNFTKHPIVKWTYDSSSCCFILVIAPRSIDDQEGKNIYFREADLHKIVYDIHLGIFICSHMLISYLVPFLPESLDQVIFTDSKKQGKMEVEEADVVELRSAIPIKPNFSTPLEEHMYFLKLYDAYTPEQRAKMEDLWASTIESASDVKVASLFLGRAKGKGKEKGKGKGKGKAKNKGTDCDEEHYLEVKKAFQGKHAVYVNAVMEMLKEIRGSF